MEFSAEVISYINDHSSVPYNIRNWHFTYILVLYLFIFTFSFMHPAYMYFNPLQQGPNKHVQKL